MELTNLEMQKQLLIHENLDLTEQKDSCEKTMQQLAAEMNQASEE